jgi:hypothetical protein
MNKFKDILYPIFLDCQQYCTDIFWENIFEGLVYGKTPYGTYISNHFLICNYKGKEFCYKLNTIKNTKTLYDDIYNLFTTKLELMSQRERVNRQIKFDNLENSIIESQKKWGNIRKKNVKNILLEKFVLNMRDKYNLTIQQCKYVLSVIFIAVIFKVISNDDILFQDGKINSINGIHFSNQKVTINKNITNLDIDFSIDTNTDKSLMSDNWEKYLKNLKSQCLTRHDMA